MIETPIDHFMLRCASLHVRDIAVLFSLISVQERSPNDLIPAVADRVKIVGLDGLTDQEYAKVFKRLLELNEIEAVDTETHRGFRVARINELRDAMTDYGRRRYFRLKQREARQ